MNDLQEGLVFSVGLGVGVAAVLGTLRFVRGWSMKPLILSVLLPALGLACYMNWGDPRLRPLLGLAWDCGAVTTGPVTVPILLALGVGVMRSQRRRQAASAALQQAAATGAGQALEGFGIVTLASLWPVLAVEIFACIISLLYSPADVADRTRAADGPGGADSVVNTSPVRDVIFAVRAILPLNAALILLIVVVLRLPLPQVSFAVTAAATAAEPEAASSATASAAACFEGLQSPMHSPMTDAATPPIPSLELVPQAIAGHVDSPQTVPVVVVGNPLTAQHSHGDGQSHVHGDSDGVSVTVATATASADAESLAVVAAPSESGVAAADGAGVLSLPAPVSDVTAEAAARCEPPGRDGDAVEHTGSIAAAGCAAAPADHGTATSQACTGHPPPAVAAATLAGSDSEAAASAVTASGLPVDHGDAPTAAAAADSELAVVASAASTGRKSDCDSGSSSSSVAAPDQSSHGGLRRHVPLLLAILEAQIGMLLFNLGLSYGFTSLGDQVGSLLPAAFTAIPGQPASPLYSFAGGVALTLCTVFILGVLATRAEPALNVLGRTVETLSEGRFKASLLVGAVCVGVGAGMAFGASKILFGVSLIALLLGKYAAAVLLTAVSDESFTCIAWDSAGVTTGPVTVPFVLSLGVGFSKASSAQEGFGILTCASVAPILTVLAVNALRGLRQWAVDRERSRGDAHHDAAASGGPVRATHSDLPQPAAAGTLPA